MTILTTELVIKLRDELSGNAKKAASALDNVRKAESNLQKQAELLGKSTKALADFQALDKRLQSTTQKFDQQRQALKDLGSQILSTDGSTKKLESAFKRAEAVLEQTRQSMEKQQKTLSTVATTFEKLSGSRLRSIVSAEETMRRQIEGTTRAIGAQAKASQKLIEAHEASARRFQRIKNTFSGIGMLAGPIILHGADEAYAAGAAVQHRRVEMRKAGMGSMVPAIEQQSLGLAAQFKTVTQAAIMEMAQEMRSVLAKPEEVAHVLPAMVAARSVLDARDPGGSESSSLGLLVKGAENLGAGQNPERLVKLIDGYVKAMQVMGKTINPEEIFAFAKNARLSGTQFSDRFLLTTAMSSLQELGGESAGKASNEAVGQLTGGLGKRTVAVKQLMNMGLIDSKDIAFNKIGEVSGVRKGVLHPVRGDHLLATDPDRFTYEVLLPAMEKAGITKTEDQIAAVRQIFSGSKSAQDLIGKFITQRESYAAHAGLYPNASGIKGAAQNRDDPIASINAVAKSLETFMGVLSSPMMLPAAHVLDTMAEYIGKFSTAYSAFAKEHPDMATALGASALAGTAATGAKLTYGLFDKIFGDGGLKTAAASQIEAGTALQAAAAHLETAATRLGGGSAGSPMNPGVSNGGGGFFGSGGISGLLGFAGTAGAAATVYNLGKSAITWGMDMLPHPKWPDGYSPDQVKNRGITGDVTDLWQQLHPLAPAAKSGAADAIDRMRERNELIESETQKLKDSVWQFGQLDTAASTLKASFDGMSGAIGGLGGGGGLMNASFGGGGPLELSGGGASGEHAEFIRRTAASMGIDPRVAVAVAKSEGLGAFVGDHGTSFGDFQLHVGGGLGDKFRRETGLNPADPKNWREMDTFALKEAGSGGWKPWHGAARIGVHGFRGIGPKRAKPSGGTIEAHAHYAPSITIHVAGDLHEGIGDKIAKKLHEHFEDAMRGSYADTAFG